MNLLANTTARVAPTGETAKRVGLPLPVPPARDCDVLPIAVVIPVLDAGRMLWATLEDLHPTEQIIVVDGGSRDGSPVIAARFGVDLLASPAGRGRQLARGAEEATAPWLLFLHADTRLDPRAWAAIRAYLAKPDNRRRAAVFRLRLDDTAWQARVLEVGVRLRVAALALPYGDQGLLIHRTLYDAVGGFAPLPLMEDVDLVRRLGRRRLRLLPGSAITSAERWRRRGWLRQSLLNLRCLALFLMGASADRIARLYDR